MPQKRDPKPEKKAEPKHKREVSATPPAQGERNAKSGFQPQDKFSAALVVEGLKEGTLRAIRIADPTAGRVDDFQILTDGRADAYQVKWELYPDSISINNLTSKDGEKPCLMAQLADGWKRIKGLRPNFRVVVHLATNARPSKSGRALPAGSPKGAHLAAFVAECWKPLKAQLITWQQIPEKWTTWMAALETSSGLTHGEFVNFVSDCELDFDSRLEDDTTRTAEEAARLSEVDEVAQFLYKTGASAERIVELSRDDLILRLGWQDAVAFRNTHDFPVDEHSYQPVRQTEQSLGTAVQQITSGYICLLGTPGSGKSSLLAKAFRQRPERVLRYFAYVPETLNAGSLRGESDNFLHDMILALQLQGINGEGGAIKQTDRLMLLKRWNSQLQQLHREYVEKRRKTIIVIDGLDHIEREQHPHHSLLNDLLLPTDVPEGVVFMLGSQLATILHPRIQHQLTTEGRTIGMEPLTHGDVGRILTAHGLSEVLSSLQQDRVYELSAGHPLALAYLANRLKALSNPAEIEAFLAGEVVFTGDIDQSYFMYWSSIVDNDPALIPVLGLISRIRGYIDLDWLETWDEKDAIARFLKNSSYLFRRETPTSWYFFHNSFRLFLTRRTARSLAGEYSEQEDRKFHSTLADRCQLATAPEHWKWEELYHRSKAQEHQRVLALTDQDIIRSQFFKFRSPSAIHGDLVLASASLQFVQDGVAAVRISLAMFEIERRRFALDIHKSALINILVQSGNVGRAMSWIRDTSRILVVSSNSLGHCQELAKAGHREEAKRLFDLVAPSGFTQDPMGMNQEDSQVSDLAGWYFAARIFEPVEVCLGTLGAIRFKAADLGRRATEYADDAENAKLHRRLIEQILHGCIFGRDWEDVEKLLPRLPQNDQAHHECLMMMVEAHLDDGETNAARRRLEELLKIRAPRSFMGTVRVAESYARLGDRDKVLEYFNQISRPVLARNGMGVLNGYDSFEPLFRYDRLAFYCDPARQWTSLVPDDDKRGDGGGLFQRALCSVAQIWARAWRRETTAGDAYQVEIADLLRFYHRDFRTMEDWDFGFEIKYSRTNLYSLLAEACAAHGPHLVGTLTKAYDRVWESNEKRYWPLDGQREIVIQVARLGLELTWAKKWLERFEVEIELGVTADTYVSESVRQSEAWLAVGEKVKALTRAEKVLRRSFGIADRKDYQLSTWIELFGEIAPNLPDRGLEAIKWIARCIRGLEAGISSRAVSGAAADLIEVCVHLHSNKAFTLFAWFEANECVWYEQALRSILKASLKEPAGDLVLRSLFIREVLIPISTHAAPWLLREFLRQIASAWSADDFAALVESLRETIKIQAPTEIRDEWLLGIAQAITDRGLALATFGLDQAILRREEPHSSSDKLILTGGKVEYLPDLATRVRSVEEIVRLRNLEADHSYFRWNRLAAALAPHFQADALLRIAELFIDDDHFAEVCEAVSQRLVDLGKTNEAWGLGKKAAEKSVSKTWQRHMDGGPRLSAFLTLLRADGAKGRPLLFEAFGVDGPPSSDNIRLLLPYLIEPGQRAELWRELENHLRALLEGTDQDPAHPDLTGTHNQQAGAPVLVEVLIHNLAHPATVLKQTAQKAHTSLILLDHAPTIEAVKKGILPASPILPGLAEVIVAVASVNPGKCIPFKAKLLAAMDTKDFEARTLCLEVAWRCDWMEFAAVRPQQPLPAIYELEIPEISYADARLIQPYDDLVSLISQGTDLPEENLTHRLIEIVRSIDVHGDLNPEAEKKMMYRLQSWGLQVRFLKPRVRLVKRGLFLLMGELADARKLPTSPYSGLPLPFRDFDPYFLVANPAPRPSMMLERVREGHAHYNEEWVRGQINIAEHVPIREPSGWIVIGSKACFRIANDTRATERTFTVLRPTNAQMETPSQPSQFLFNQINLSSVAEYHDYEGQWDGKRLVIKSSPLIEGPGSPFLALHPDVARQMGWRAQGNGLLAWADKSGQTVVESRWWQDGPVSVLNLYSDVEIADGWYVAMAPTAVAALEARFGPLSRIIRGQRSAYASSGLLTGPVLNQKTAF